MRPKFTIANDEYLYINAKWYCNGHWLLNRSSVDRMPLAPKALSSLRSLQHGTYYSGTKNGPDASTVPDIEAIIPRRDGYVKLKPEPVGVGFKHEIEISSYKYEADEGRCVHIDPRYVPLMGLGHAFIKGEPGEQSVSAVLILDSQDLNGELIGLVMPIRK